jgi:hypothetical protein
VVQFLPEERIEDGGWRIASAVSFAILYLPSSILDPLPRLTTPAGSEG